MFNETAPSRVFDLSSINASLDDLKARRKRLLIASVGLLVVAAIVIAGFDARGSIDRTYSAYETLSLIVADGFIVFLIVTTNPSILSRRSGAAELRVSEQGFELLYPDGDIFSVNWLNPKLEFDLIDASGANPAKVLSGSPYSLAVCGTRSLLSEEAYFEVLSQVRRHGLIDTTARGSPWIYSSDANPLIHHVSGSGTSNRVG